MDIELDFIQFQGQLFDSKNTPVSEFKIAIQFYNANIYDWITLTTSVIQEGKFNHKIEIPDRISTTNQTIRIVREVLQEGGVPSFRIVKIDEEQELTEVIASNFNIVIQKEKAFILIDFGINWLLDEVLKTNVKTHIISGTPLPIFNLISKISNLEIHNKTLGREIIALQKNVDNYEVIQEEFITEITELKKQIEEKEILLRELNVSVNELNSKLQEEIENKKTLIDAITASEGQNLEFQNRIKELELKSEESEILQKKIEELESQLQIQQKENEELIAEREAFLLSVSKLHTDIRDYKNLLVAKDTDIERKQIVITNLEQEIQKLSKELEELKAFHQTDQPNKLSASKVYGSIVNDVIKADEELINSKFKLANVSLNLKTTVEKGPEGTVLGLLDFETAKVINGAAISDISIDIVPNQNSTTTIGEKMPNILGLTETATRKKLSEYGLKLDAIYHPTNDENLIEGQSFKQSPAPNTTIVEGQEVVVIFAKSLN